MRCSVFEFSVTKIRLSATNPRGAGRKPLPAGEKKLKTSVSLAPDLVEELSQHGGGVLSKGIEMKVRDTLVTNEAGAVVGVVHVGPGEEPYQAWTRKRLTGGRVGNSHALLGTFSSMEAAVDAVRKAT